MAGVYIHIPFCRSKCGYCDFYSTTDTGQCDAVVGAILSEMERERGFLGGEPVRTLYVGGGTPSLLSPRQLQSFIDTARGLWDCSGLGEITVEANPDDLTAEYLAELAATEVNRLSIGIQSFADRDLRLMNRRHTAAAAENAVRKAQRAGFDNITIDLIYGIPGMSLAEWRANIERALALGVQHISAYHLTIEHGTPFGRLAASGRFTPAEEAASEEQYLLLHRMLTDAGFEHYEISNFAFPGLRARHNSSYWSGEPYLGVGPSAHSFDGRVRRSSPASVAEYLAAPTAYTTEALTPDDRYNETVMTGLRTAAGVELERLRADFGDRRAEYFVSEAARHLAAGAMVCDDGRYRIPAERFLMSDAVISDLFIG